MWCAPEFEACAEELAVPSVNGPPSLFVFEVPSQVFPGAVDLERHFEAPREVVRFGADHTEAASLWLGISAIPAHLKARVSSLLVIDQCRSGPV